MVIILALFIVGLIYLMPSKEHNDLSVDNQLEYIYTNSMETIYLLDANDYVAKTEIQGYGDDTSGVVRDVMQGLIVDGEKNNVIPNGFRSLIPSGTEVLDVSLDNGVLTIDFSRELLDINEKYEEKMIEAIVYTLTSIDGIDKVVIRVCGEVLDKLPNSGKSLPSFFDRNYGINKVYDLATTKDIDSYTVYYVGNFNGDEYYVPVTKYINGKNEDKIRLIVNELATSPIYEENLMSFVNGNVSLIDYEIKDDVLKLNFNDSILDDVNHQHILEEVIYAISLSIFDACDVKEVVFLVDGKEFYQNSLKMLE